MNLYIHIPFCKNKCSFCHFCSYINGEKYYLKYFQELSKEITNKIKFYKINKLDTIYFGGGTPSLVPETYISDIINLLKRNVNFNKNIEITLESNPEDLLIKKINIYKKIGVNRISIGIQTFDEKLLNSMKRSYDFNLIKRKVALLKNKGFNNINFDLIFGYPGQTFSSWVKTLNLAISLNPSHLSCYSLEVEPNTNIFNQIYIYKVNRTDDILDRKMYYKTVEILKQNKYLHYEISNFCKKGYECKHNVDFWNNRDYIGVGLSAVSYINSHEIINTSSLNEYLNGKHLFYKHKFNKNNINNRRICLGLRLTHGLIVNNEKAVIKRLEIQNFLKRKENIIYLTDKGIDFYNFVFNSINE